MARGVICAVLSLIGMEVVGNKPMVGRAMGRRRVWTRTVHTRMCRRILQETAVEARASIIPVVSCVMARRPLVQRLPIGR